MNPKTIPLLPSVKIQENLDVKVEKNLEEKLKMNKEKLANLHFKTKAKLTKKSKLKTLRECHFEMFHLLKQNRYFEIFFCTTCHETKRCNQYSYNRYFNLIKTSLCLECRKIK